MMFTDQWGQGPILGDMQTMPGLLEVEHQQNLQVLRRIDAYLARLQLNEAQRLWLRSEVLMQLQGATGSSVDRRWAQAFAALQQSLSTLHGGDELEARVAVGLGLFLPADVDRAPSRWLQAQMGPRITRSCMASRPMDRSWLGLLSRNFQTLRGLWRKRRLLAFGGVR